MPYLLEFFIPSQYLPEVYPYLPIVYAISGRRIFIVDDDARTIIVSAQEDYIPIKETAAIVGAEHRAIVPVRAETARIRRDARGLVIKPDADFIVKIERRWLEPEKEDPFEPEEDRTTIANDDRISTEE